MSAIPRLLVLTDGQDCGGRPLTEVVAAAVDGGARAVLLREKHLPLPERVALAAAITALLNPVGGCLIVASDPTIAPAGVHLAAADPFPDAAPGLVGRSCHSPADVARAAEQGCDYATLSPIHLTDSKPGYGPALGPESLRGLSLPTLALGGVDPTNAAACLDAGAVGVAVMGAVMRAPDPAAVVSVLLDAVG